MPWKAAPRNYRFNYFNFDNKQTYADSLADPTQKPIGVEGETLTAVSPQKLHRAVANDDPLAREGKRERLVRPKVLLRGRKRRLDLT